MDGETEIVGKPARFGAGLGAGSEQPAVSAGDSQPAIAIAFTADDDRADVTRGEADKPEHL